MELMFEPVQVRMIIQRSALNYCLVIKLQLSAVHPEEIGLKSPIRVARMEPPGYMLL